jgi:hypothetical protein
VFYKEAMHNPIALFSTLRYTLELHLSGLIGKTKDPDLQEVQIIEFFFENRLHWYFEVGKILQMADLGYILIYEQTER